MKRYLRISVVMMIVAMVGFAAGLVMLYGSGGGGDRAGAAAFSVAQPEVIDIPQQHHQDMDEDVMEQTDDVPRISENTLMIYDYHQPETGDHERIVEHPSRILLNMTEEELAALMVDWQVLSFTSDEVHLRQNEALEHREFTIGVHEGYIAVFYNSDYGIKELTGRPISALAPEEQERLMEGIKVVGNEELMRALEDFSS
ncbi:MAG: hypothetical protein FWC93_02630 [Defluviitaleaceae bacterium]|nr:hypothetical protein [Defluviitaleaceae bacterium]